MNSVIQQLYMIPAIRNGILAIEGSGSDVDDDMSGDEKQDNEVTYYILLVKFLMWLNVLCFKYVNIKLNFKCRGILFKPTSVSNSPDFFPLQML